MTYRGICCRSGRISAYFAVTSILAAIGLAAAGVARAENGRDFSALFDFGHVTQLDPTHLSVQWHLRLQNQSQELVTNATIALTHPAMSAFKKVVFPLSVTLDAHAVASVSSTLTVDEREYQRWQRGLPPLLVIQFVDSRGLQIERPIELMRRPGLEERP